MFVVQSYRALLGFIVCCLVCVVVSPSFLFCCLYLVFLSLLLLKHVKYRRSMLVSMHVLSICVCIYIHKNIPKKLNSSYFMSRKHTKLKWLT